MKDLREFHGPDDRSWLVTVAWRGGDRVLRFQTTGEVRIAHYRDDWDELSADRLREILTTEATPESEWRARSPATSNDDEGLHGLSDAPGG